MSRTVDRLDALHCPARPSLGVLPARRHRWLARDNRELGFQGGVWPSTPLARGRRKEETGRARPGQVALMRLAIAGDRAMQWHALTYDGPVISAAIICLVYASPHGWGRVGRCVYDADNDNERFSYRC